MIDPMAIISKDDLSLPNQRLDVLRISKIYFFLARLVRINLVSLLLLGPLIRNSKK